MDTNTVLMNTWNTPLESYQQRVYKNSLATVKRQIQQVENPMPAVVLSVEVVHVDNAVLLDNLTFGVVLEETDSWSSNPNIPTDNNCMNDKLHFGLPGCGRDYKDEGGKSVEGNAFPTASCRNRDTTKLVRFDQGTGDVNGYEGADGYNAGADELEQAPQADNGSTQNEVESGHSTKECEDWTAYFCPVKYSNHKANAMASDVSEAQTVL